MGQRAEKRGGQADTGLGGFLSFGEEMSSKNFAEQTLNSSSSCHGCCSLSVVK